MSDEDAHADSPLSTQRKGLIFFWTKTWTNVDEGPGLDQGMIPVTCEIHFTLFFRLEDSEVPLDVPPHSPV